jgi:hypothetical protein
VRITLWITPWHLWHRVTAHLHMMELRLKKGGEKKAGKGVLGIWALRWLLDKGSKETE